MYVLFLVVSTGWHFTRAVLAPPEMSIGEMQARHTASQIASSIIASRHQIDFRALAL